jgi:hypothetical protein
METLIVNCYYTYIIIDPRNSQAFYVGKGKNRRMYDHWKHRNAKLCCNYQLRKTLKEIEHAGLRLVYAVPLCNVTEREALDKEIELVTKFGRLDIGTGILCNLTDGGDTGASSWSPQTRLNKSQIELEKNKGVPVSQYTLNGIFISSYPSAKRASESVTEANRSYISQCCKKKRQSSGGFLWAYTKDGVPLYTHAYNTKVHQYTLDGQFLTEYRCVSEAAKAVDAFPGDISSACRGKLKTCKKFIWKYI